MYYVHNCGALLNVVCGLKFPLEGCVFLEYLCLVHADVTAVALLSHLSGSETGLDTLYRLAFIDRCSRQGVRVDTAAVQGFATTGSSRTLSLYPPRL